jgi:YVTN family beta-propeller protein
MLCGRLLTPSKSSVHPDSRLIARRTVLGKQRRAKKSRAESARCCYHTRWWHGTPYVTNAGSNSVSVIDTSTNAVSATLPVGVRPVNCRRLLIHLDELESIAQRCEQNTGSKPMLHYARRALAAGVH